MKTENRETYFTYVIYSSNIRKYYIGSTSNLDKRLKEHNSGKTNSTRNKGPWILVFFEKQVSRHDAITREKQIKSYKGGNAFKKLIGPV